MLIATVTNKNVQKCLPSCCLSVEKRYGAYCHQTMKLTSMFVLIKRFICFFLSFFSKMDNNNNTGTDSYIINEISVKFKSCWLSTHRYKICWLKKLTIAFKTFAKYYSQTLLCQEYSIMNVLTKDPRYFNTH